MLDDIKVHSSGAKTSGNLPPYECLTDEFIERCAERMRLGLEHYGKHNWVKGSLDKEYVLERLRHAHKHLRKVMREIDHDIPMNDDDLAAVAVNVMFAMYYHPTVTLEVISNKKEAQPITAEPLSKNIHLWLNNQCTKCGLPATNLTLPSGCDENLLKSHDQ